MARWIVLVDAAREEAGELAASLVEDAERDVARPGEVGGGLQQPVEHRLEVQLGQEAAPGVDEACEPVLVQAVQRGHARKRAYRRACAATCGATLRGGRDHQHRAGGLAQDLVVTSGDHHHVDVPARLGHQCAGATARDARRCRRRRQGLGVGQPPLGDSVVADGDQPHVGADALGERRRERHRVVDRPGGSARDGDARRREGPDEAVSVRRHDDRARRLGEQPRHARLGGEHVLADDDRVGSLAASQRLDSVGEGHAGDRQVAHARIGAQRRVDVPAGVAQAGAATSGRLGAAGQRSRRGRQDVRHHDRRVVACQLRREDEGIAAFGLTGESDEDGGEHSLHGRSARRHRHP